MYAFNVSGEIDEMLRHYEHVVRAREPRAWSA
jgi:hypothetical protein